MQSYIQSILPRLQRYSKQLNDEANFVEIPWAYLDVEGVKITYIFRQNNELLVTKKGEVATGRWEYLPSMQSLLIEYEGKKRMYNQGFLDKTVLLLRKEGTEELLPLANAGLLPDLNIKGYLRRRMVEKVEGMTSGAKKEKAKAAEKNSYKVRIKTGQYLIVWEGDKRPGMYLETGARVTKEDGQSLPSDGDYYLEEFGIVIKVVDGLITEKKDKTRDKEILAFSILIFVVLIFLFWAFS